MNPYYITYHSDHLGSASFLTDNNGNETQQLVYLPYGEDCLDMKYKLGGKEKDLESGYNNGADNLVMLVEPDGREFDLAINYNDRKFNEVFTNLNRAR